MSIEKINKDHNLSQSENIVESNIEKLKALFPEIVTEGKIDFKVLQEVLGEEVEQGEEYYRFTWAGKANARREAQKPSTGTLRPAPEDSVDWDTTQNLYIEGDNLEVLKLLQKSYAGKIKMIYIDPPYNTGKDFVYKDNYKDNLRNYQEVTGQLDDQGNKLSTNSDSDGRYHSNWLNMMYPRLRLARNLLKEDGVIFMSIDDNEKSNLEKICVEVFGEENKLDRGVLTWINKGSTKGFNKIVKNHEYILAFGKNSNLVKSFYGKNFSDELEDIEHYCFNKPNPGNPICDIKFLAGTKIKGKINIEFKGSVGDDVKLEILEGIMKFENSVLVEDVTLRGAFPYRNQIELFFANKSKNLPTYDVKGQEWLEIYFNSKGLPRYRKERNTKIISSVIDEKSIPNYGSKDISDLLGKKEIFSFPKPKELLIHLFSYFVAENEIILDLFSGSGSSAHSTFLLNSLSNSNRKFIQVQLPEPTDEKSEAFKAGYKSITEIGKERIRRAAAKIKKEHPDKAKNLDLGFKVFKLDTSNIKAWDGNPANLDNSLFDAQDNIKTNRTEHDVLYEILLKYGLDLTLPIEEKQIEGKTVFSVGYGALFICLGDNLNSTIAEGIGKWKEELQPEVCRVVFKDSGFTDVEKTNSVQILKRFGITEIKSI